MFKGNRLTLSEIESGFFKLVIDHKDRPVNVINQQLFAELSDLLDLLESSSCVKGLMVVSAKKSFVAGADIAEFSAWFAQPSDALIKSNLGYHDIFNRIEKLPFPTVALINGQALGGGLELALTADYRLMATDTTIGFPEVHLGLYPGWGGCVRVSRLTDMETTIQWITDGRERNAQQALEVGVVDAVVDGDQLEQSALDLLKNIVSGPLTYIDKRTRKVEPMSQKPGYTLEQLTEQFIKRKGLDTQAAQQAIETLYLQALLPRDKAQLIETEGFVKLAQSAQSRALVQLFFNQQKLKKETKKWLNAAEDIQQAAVLGAGIMGGGIAFQSASRGTALRMKDIQQAALDTGMSEVNALLAKQQKRGRYNEQQVEQIRSAISPSLTYEGFEQVELVVEAVVENPAVKAAVLADVESEIPSNAVLASNTSTISITKLAEGLKHPERFCGIHFFNPVHMMPLVEVIRGKDTNEQTVSTAVGWAKKLGKTPIVINDCAGFLVNRILFPYLKAFSMLVADGVDLQRIDRVMESFGWPMGPAFLIDVIGTDTCFHADQVLAEAYPDRMRHEGINALDVVYQKERFGQKNGKGFYSYQADEKGRLQRSVDQEFLTELASIQQQKLELTDQQILDRMMIPLCLEAQRCLSEGIVGSAAEVDMGLILGLGFPRFRGGALQYIEEIGAEEFTQLCQQYESLGALYQPVEKQS